MRFFAVCTHFHSAAGFDCGAKMLFAKLIASVVVCISFMQIECQGDPTDDLPSDFKFFPDFSCHQGFSRPEFVEIYKESLVEARNLDERHSYDGDDETKLERCSKYWMLRKLRITGEYSIHRELSKPDTYFVPEPPNETLGSFGDELRNKWIGKIREDCQDPLIGTMIMDSKHCTDPDIEILYNCISKSVNC